MGRAKALLPFRGGTFLSVLAEALSGLCDPMAAVFGFDADRVACAVPQGLLPAINTDYRLGMLTSLQCGLRSLGEPGARVLFTMVDHPAVMRSTVDRLIRADGDIVIPRMNGRRGHPVVVSPEIAAEFLREPVTSKVRDVIDRHSNLIRYIDVKDAGISDDVDDPAAYEALLAREALHR